MDPRAALDLAESELRANRPRSALEPLLSYYNWRVMGGFQPLNGDNTARDLAYRIQDALMNQMQDT